MRKDGFYDSKGEGRIHYCVWTPEGDVRAVVQIVHGIAEHVERYDEFAEYLCSRGYAVAAEDHMGHGKSVFSQQGYFKGGWFTAAEDTVTLTGLMQQRWKDVPYAFLGHSMGSFLTRTILCRYEDLRYDAVILSGTGWQPRAGLPLMHSLCRAVCSREGEKSRSPFLNKLIFGAYNQKVPAPRTEVDWLTRDTRVVDAYLQSPDCGFPATAGLLRDLMEGLIYIEKYENLLKMRRDLPVFFASGAMDPVGNYGHGVMRAVSEFRKAGMADVTVKIYPMDRHEILNEQNREEVYEDLSSFLEEKLFGKEPL